MAEQRSHNVVDNTESTSGSPLVDAAANQTNAASADSGTAHDSPPLQTKNDGLQAPDTTDELAPDASEITASLISPSPAPHATLPSDRAFDAVPTVLEPQAKLADNSLILNGVSEMPGNGDGQADESSTREGSVDVSLNSDTEGSRGDASEQKKDDDKHHTRTNSVKKPAIFSKVSVTKNFLAKSATASPATTKPGDKPSPVGTPPQTSAAKPRLIAKTGASLRDVQKARVGADGAGGPDASKVWNKNRPVPPPPPRQFTDEELKQQYGIHLATRLQTDENGKESKWADIDDDEDDWAPETVVWMDGTKSTLTHQEAAMPQSEEKPASPQPQTAAESAKPVMAPRKPTELGPQKTILKPGAIAAAAQAKQNGGLITTPAEKAALLAKAAAPAPNKSPWAALPPVDKISPVNPPVQQAQQPRFATQDARAYEAALPQQPAREIAADTFDRSWREGEGGTRELFNSANGRYEPVPEGRRGSIKPDSVRKPAVLQRPLPSAAAPAEPSPAFQTRSTGQVDGSWGRRRGSSVSQGSIPPMRRMSVTKGAEVSPAPERRTSMVIGHDLRTSPKMARNEAAPPMFSQQSAWEQQLPPQPEPGTEAEDPVKVQERIMREKRELAKKRRQEEEEKAEAEKQERLKARLAQLEGAGKSRKEREAEAAAAAAVVTPADEKPPPSNVTTSNLNAEDTRAQPQSSADTTAMASAALEPQSLPQPPETAHMKAPSPAESLPSPLPPKPQTAAVSDRSVAAAEQDQRQQPRPHLSPRTNARAPFQQQPTPYRLPPSTYSSPGERKQQPFGRPPLQNNDAFSTLWPTTAPNGNVWGTSGIGNGTFENSNAFAPIPMSQQTSKPLPPPGMARPTPSRISPQSLAQEAHSPSLQQQSIAEPSRVFGPPGFDARPDPFANQARPNGTSPAPALTRQTHAPGPIAPPSRAQQSLTKQQEEKAQAWRSAAGALPEQYQSEASAADANRHEAPPSAPRDDTIKETFKRTSAQPGKLGASRKYEQAEYTIHDAQGSRSVQSLSPAPPNAQTQPVGPFSTTSPLQQDPWKKPGERTVRIPDGSLNPAHGGSSVQQPPIAPPSTQQPPPTPDQGIVKFPASPLPLPPAVKDQSPPPPDTSSHPVNSGDSSHPLVRLPPGKPVVKLPPAQSQLPVSPPNPIMTPQLPISNVGAPRPIASQKAWQERFNGLLGTRTSMQTTAIQTEVPPSPPKTPPKVQGPTLAVAASSRVVMDEAPNTTGATVSLPQMKKTTSKEGFTIDESADVVSKARVEGMFFEELSFGSLPKVAVPRSPVYDERVYEPLPSDLGSKQREVRALEIRSITEMNLRDIHPKYRDGVYVHLPHHKIIRKFVGQSTSRKPSSAPHGTRKPSGRFSRGGKGRDGVATTSAATNGVTSAAATKTGSQSGTAPASDSATTTSNSANGTVKRSSAWPKPPRGGGGHRRPHAPPAQQSVKPVS